MLPAFFTMWTDTFFVGLFCFDDLYDKDLLYEKTCAYGEQVCLRLLDATDF